MNFDQLDRTQLLELLHGLLERMQESRTEQAGTLAEHGQLVQELRAYQVELEIQNRELRDAQLELERSRDRYAELYERAPVAYFTLDKNQLIQRCNVHAAALLDRLTKRLVGQPLGGLLAGDDVGPFHALLARAEQTGEAASSELTLRVRGQAKVLQVLVNASHEPDQHELAYRCAVLDVTERARAEAERDRAYAAERALHERFEALDRIHLALSELLATEDRANADAVLATVTEHVLKWLGAVRAEIHLAGESPRSIARDSRPPPPHPMPLTLSVPIALGRVTLGTLNVSFQRPRSSAVELQRTLELLAERVALALERARLNRIEEDERARLSLLEQVGKALASCRDLQSTYAVLGDLPRAVVPRFASALMLFVGDGDEVQLLGASHVDPRGARLLERLARPIGARLRRAIAEAGAAVTLPLAELAQEPRLVGALAFACVTAIPLIARDRKLGVLAFGHPRERLSSSNLADVFEQLSDRVALAVDAAKLVEELRTAVASRDTLLAIVSHDLRSPLNAISLTASALSATPNDRERRGAGQQIQLIQRSVARMSCLIEDLLTAGNMDSGHFSVQPTRHHPAELVREVCELIEPLSRAKNLSLMQSVAAELPLVAVDRPRILQVLTNLLGNAIKFTPAGGVLRVLSEQCEQGVRFGVIDTGPGIAPQLLRQVFERYWRGAAERHVQGLGLGLFIAQRIVSAHGGRIWVESTPGKGASFYFTVPPAASLREVDPLLVAAEVPPVYAPLGRSG